VDRQRNYSATLFTDYRIAIVQFQAAYHSLRHYCTLVDRGLEAEIATIARLSAERIHPPASPLREGTANSISNCSLDAYASAGEAQFRQNFLHYLLVGAELAIRINPAHQLNKFIRAIVVDGSLARDRLSRFPVAVRLG